MDSVWLPMLATAMLGCSGDGEPDEDPAGGSGGGVGFVPAVAPVDICALLGTADVATLMNDPPPGMSGTADYGDAWASGCEWSDQTRGSVSLGVIGAATEVGLQVVLDPPATNRGTREEIADLGDAAAYWESNAFDYRGVAATYGPYLVDLSTMSVDPPPTKDAFIALVRKVLPQLE